MSVPDNVQTIVDTTLQAAEARELTPGKIYAWLTPGGTVQQVDLTGDKYRETPARKRGNVIVRDVPSFLAYHAKHADDGTEVYADLQRRTVTAVLDAHTGTGARWGEHRATLELRTTTAWNTWMSLTGRWMEQTPMAEHFADNLDDIREPDAAYMYEVVQSIEASSKQTFKSSTRLQSGERQLVYTEDVNATAGGTKKLVIPEKFTLGMPVFEGAALADEVNVWFRFRIDKGQLSLSYKLDRPEDVLARAFGDVVLALGNAIGDPLNGTPA